MRTILALARSLDLVTVAEGVETSAQHGALPAKGCTRYQGYLLSTPVEETELLQVLGRGGARVEAPVLPVPEH